MNYLMSLLFFLVFINAEAGTKNGAASSLLTPDNHVIIFIDHQPQMFFGVQSHDRQLITNNTVGAAKSAKLFKVPTILTTVAAKTFSGPLLPELKEVFPNSEVIDRTTMNTWEDERIRKAMKKLSKKKVVILGLWTEVCVVYPVLSAMEDGYDVYFISDASGATSVEAHTIAVQRMIQAGAKPLTWLQYLLELQRDWARGETYMGVYEIAKQHAGAYGLGMLYANEMFHAKEGN